MVGGKAVQAKRGGNMTSKKKEDFKTGLEKEGNRKLRVKKN